MRKQLQKRSLDGWDTELGQAVRSWVGWMLNDDDRERHEEALRKWDSIRLEIASSDPDPETP